MTKTNLKNGKIRHGMMIVPGSPPSLANDSPLHPRAGAPKRSYTPAAVFGQRRVSTGVLSAHIHGIAVQDEPNDKGFLNGKTVPTGFGMGSSKTQSQRGTDKGPDAGSEHLRAAGHLSRKD